MKVLRHVVIALLAVAASTAVVVTQAASTTNYSDQWWIETESGWGASILQQGDVLFIDLFVYGTDTKPTWFTAAALLQGGSAVGHTVFAGNLIATTGPFYGSGAFDPGQVVRRVTGTLTFDADSATTARLTYSVDGTTVAKNVTRQTWRNENLAGSYRGVLVYDQTNCGSENGHFDENVLMTIGHPASNVVTITFTTDTTCVFTGTYTQSGHMGQILNGAINCAATATDPALTGTLNLVDIERTTTGFSGQFNGVLGASGLVCTLANGRIGGVLR